MPTDLMAETAAPDSAAAPVAEIENDLVRRITVFEDAARRTRERADSEAIHDTRVAARRLLATLSVWRELLEPGAHARARRRLRALRRSLGAAREAEVHVELLRERMPRRPAAARRAAEALLERLERRRDRRRRRAAEETGKRAVAGLLATLRAAARDLPANSLTRPNALASAREQLERREWEAQQALDEAVRRKDDEALHAARIAVKKWRYVTECLSLAGGSTTPLDRLRELQEVLGEIHDRAALLSALPRAGDDPAKHALAPLVNRLERERRADILKFERLAGPKSPGRRARKRATTPAT